LLRSRTLRGVLSVAVASVVLAACAGDPTGPLATVDGVEIPRSDLEGWMRTAVDGNSEIDETGLQADLLSRAIQQQIIDGVLVERGLSVDPEQVTEVRAAIESQVGGPEALTATLADIGFAPEFFDDVFIPVEAAVETLVLSLSDGLTLQTRTARHILVETADEADEIFALLADGADFAQLAIERSQDPGSGAAGGTLGPQQRGTFVPPFDDAVWAASLDTVLEPVESEFGFHIIEVTATDEVSADALGPDQRRQLVGAELEAIITTAFTQAEVRIDPTIGTWDTVTGAVNPA
jgi:parvulin-like peptidyl-prolyl isomerase